MLIINIILITYPSYYDHSGIGPCACAKCNMLSPLCETIYYSMPFSRLMRHAGKRWAYFTPHPQGWPTGIKRGYIQYLNNLPGSSHQIYEKNVTLNPTHCRRFVGCVSKHVLRVAHLSQRAPVHCTSCTMYVLCTLLLYCTVYIAFRNCSGGENNH